MKHLLVPLSWTFVPFIGLARAEVPQSFSRLWNDPAVTGRIERGIEKHRKGDATIEVVGKDGTPLANAMVEVRQQTHEFLFGCNLFVLDQLATPDLNAKYERAFINLFNHEWKTNLTLKTDANGRTSFRGFHGKYLLRLTVGGETRKFPFELKSGAGASRATWTLN